MAKRRSTKQVVFSLEAYVADFQRGMRGAQGSLTRLEQTTTRFVRTWRNIGVYSGVAIILREIAMLSAHMTKLNTDVINTQRAFTALGDTDVVMAELREATQGMVDDLTLMQQAVKFQNFGLPVQQLGKFLEFAQYRAATTGESIDYLVNSIVIGLGRKSIKVLDNLSLNVAEFQELVRGGLTYTEALAQIMDQEMGNSIATVADSTQRLATAWKNLQIGISQWAGNNQLFEDLATLFNWITPDRLSSVEEVRDRIFEINQEIGHEAKMAADWVNQLTGRADIAERRLAGLNKELGKMSILLKQLEMREAYPEWIAALESGEETTDTGGEDKKKIKLADFGDYVLPEESWEEYEARLDEYIDRYVTKMNNAAYEVNQARLAMGDPFAGALTDEVDAVLAYFDLIEPMDETVDQLGTSFSDAAKEVMVFGNAILGVVDMFSKSKMELRDWVRILFQVGGFAAMIAGSGGFGAAFPFINKIFGRAAQGGMASGLTLVGEAGPELVQFNNPARVYSNPQTARLLQTQTGVERIEIEGDKLVILLSKLGLTNSYT